MMQYKTVPIQANFISLNPKIPALEPDRIEIPLSTHEWDTDFQVACINDYGAAGSNAAMIVCQPPVVASYSHSRDYETSTGLRIPIFISAYSEESLKAYCVALQKTVPSSAAPKHFLSSLAFNLADKQNRSLSHVISTTVSDLADFNSKLDAVVSGKLQSSIKAEEKPVVLCLVVRSIMLLA